MDVYCPVKLANPKTTNGSQTSGSLSSDQRCTGPFSRSAHRTKNTNISATRELAFCDPTARC